MNYNGPTNQRGVERKQISILSITKKKERKYKNNFIKFGFTFIEEKGEHHPKCVMYLEILPSKV